MERDKLRINGQSPTRMIRAILRPYWQGRLLEDQDWAIIVACLERVEKACPYCDERCKANETNP